jgi:lipopolysaccharide export system permease protein
VTILDRMIIRRFVFTYLAFATSVLLVYVVTDFFNRLDVLYAAAHSLQNPRPLLYVILEYYGAVVPEIYYTLGPFVTLVSALWVVFELRRHNELIPIMAAGIAPWRIVAPLFFAASILAVVMYLDQEILIPQFADQHRAATSLRRDHIIPNPIPDSRSGVIMARNYSPKNQLLMEAHYTLLDDHFRESISAVASTARYDKEKRGWIFREGFLIRTERQPDGGERDVLAPIPATGTLIATDIEPRDVESATVDTAAYHSSAELRRMLEHIPGFQHLKVQLARRVSYPCASLILMVLGLPFVIRGDKGAAALGLLACIGLCAFFFIVTAFCEDMGSRPGGPDPTLCAWLPNIAFGLPGLYVFRRAASR